MNRIIYLSLLSMFVVIFSVTDIFAQTNIKGKVTDSETGTVLSGATIELKNTKVTTVTKADGTFSLSIPQNIKEPVLVITYVGYEQITRLATPGDQNIEIKLKVSAGQLSDVVIVGVQAQHRTKSTSSISSVSGKDIENLPAPSLDQLLQGRVAGMNVQVGSAEPGIAPTVIVRGNSKVSTRIGDDPEVARAQAMSGPLYVIDGMPINPDDISSLDATGTNFLAGINVNDIASVDVQKDAAATAAWGSRGANGVIYITTKGGATSIPEFRINVYGGVVQVPQLLKTAVGAAERQQKMDIINTYGTYENLRGLPISLTDKFNPAYNNATDWQGLFYGNGSIKNIDASVAASNQALNYRIGLNYYDEQGIIKAFGFQRYGFRGNFNFKISPKINSQLIVGISKADRQKGIKYNNSDDNTPVSGSAQPSSLYKLTGFDSSSFLGLYSKLRNKNINDYYSLGFTFNYSILPALKYTFQGSADIQAINRDYFQPSNLDAIAADLDPDEVQPSYAESSKSTFATYFMNSMLTYTKAFKTDNHVHNLMVTVSQQFSSDVVNTTFTSGWNVPSNNIQVVQGIPQVDLSGFSNYGADAMLSLMGQVQYDYDSKYLFYGSYRGDASSRFGKNSKWGYFPAASLGWIASREQFMEKISNIISFLKFRVSYGISGRQSPDYYAPFNSYVLSGTYQGSSAIQPDYRNGLTKNNLTWAKVYQKNLGIDVEVLNGKIAINADIYDKLSKGDFYDFELPFFTGFQSINFNANDLWVSNRGLDLTVSVRDIIGGNKAVRWNTQLTLSHNKNLIARLPNNNRTFVIDDWNGISRIYSVGQPIYEMFQLRYVGVFNNASEIPFDPLTGKPLTYFKGNHTVVPGDPAWSDVNKIGDVWPDEDNGAQYGDRIPTGDPNPKYTGGWVNEFTYKNFTLSILSIFTWKRDVVNTYFQQQVSNVVGGYSSSINSFATGRLPDMSGYNYWTPQSLEKNPDYKADFPSINPFGPSYYQYIPISSQFNEDGSYFKVKNVMLNYRLPVGVLSKLKLKDFRIYGNVENVFTLKKGTMPNPELVDQLGVYSGGAYPIPSKFTLGAEIKF